MKSGFVVTITIEEDEIAIFGADKLKYGQLQFLEHKFREWKEALLNACADKVVEAVKG